MQMHSEKRLRILNLPRRIDFPNPIANMTAYEPLDS